MIKNLETLRNKPDVLEENLIQGLYSPVRATASFWTLKVKIELSSFSELKKGEVKK